MFSVLGDPLIYTYLDFPPPPSLEHLSRVYAQLETRRSPDGTEEWLNWIVVRNCHPERERGAWAGGVAPPAPPGPSPTLGVTEPIGVVQATISAGGCEVAYI